MKWSLGVSVFSALIVCSSVGYAQKRAKPAQAGQPAPVVKVESWNTFYTIDEFKAAGRKVGTPVTVEGYIVTGSPSGGNFAFRLVDSVDKVLSGKDAERLAAVAVRCTVTPPVLKRSPGLAWSRNGAQKFTMYIGGDRAIRALHNEVDKIRVTGRVGPGVGVINPVTQVEIMDTNGEWKPLVR